MKKLLIACGVAVLGAVAGEAATCVVNAQEKLPAGALSAAGLKLGAKGGAQDKTITVLDCPKCDCLMKLAPDGKSATVNVARLSEGAANDAETAARVKRMVEKAEELLQDDPPTDAVKRPLMGWSSWNCFRIEITEEKMLGIARAMATNGLKQAGYVYVNMDDGFFNGHGPDGKLRFNPRRFPRGLKHMVDEIHSLGLKAGTYSDAGDNTCGSVGDHDVGGVGAGLWGHDAADMKLHFNELGFDFIKVDWCGGRHLKLDERKRYTEIAQALRATGRADARYNICRWAFPGTWAADIAESWRTGGDIRANWGSVRNAIGRNLYLSAFCSPGHYNDMDMMEVGQRKDNPNFKAAFRGDTGLTEEEEIAHFGMWCMMSSPLVIGSDVRKIFEPTLKLVSNRSLLKTSQNDLGLQAYVVWRDGNAYVLVKDALTLHGKVRYAALYNAGDQPYEFSVDSRVLDLGGKVEVFDLVRQAEVGSFTGKFNHHVPPHAARFFRLDAAERLDREVYEAETAFLREYQCLRNATDDKNGTAHARPFGAASGGTEVGFLGKRATNDLVWRDVYVSRPGIYRLEFKCRSHTARWFAVEVNGGVPMKVEVPQSGDIRSYSVWARLEQGSNRVRLFNDQDWMPDFDVMYVKPADPSR